MIRQISRYCVLIVLAFVVLGAEDLARAAGVVTNMRHWTAPDHTRIVFDLTDPPVFTASRQDGVLAVTFRNMTWGETAPRETEFDQSRIGKLSISTSEEGDTLVRLEMANNVETNVFPLKKFMDKPDRLVIDIEFPEVSRRQSRMREQIKVSTDKKIIVIDPGHGGDDPGAVGKNGTYEKDVVLSISRRLKNNLDRHGFFQAYLTRDGDYYVPFNKRLQIAREFGADMFISVHADAARNREARGSSVYCLSSGEASSVAAKILAQNENLADIVGGSREADMKEETNPILINMCQTNTINISKAFGMNVLWELSNVGELKFDRVQEAPFRVLKMPEIPSVLIETAYISNLEEEKLLRSPAFQQKLADTIARAVVRFFLMEPGGEPPLLVQRPKTVGRTSAIAPKPAVFHTVVKGETLSKISREYGVPLRQLLKMNGMRMEDSLYVGKRLKIEEGGGESLAASGGQGGGKPSGRAPAGGGDHKAFFTYTVVKGDSLIRIGDRFGVTLESILALNGLKPGAPLHVGKRLKIEGTDPAVGTRQPGRTYRVKAGDTLLNIAKKQDVPVGTLLKLNGMKLNDPLYKGRVLILEEREGGPGEKKARPKQAGGAPGGGGDHKAFFTYTVVKGDSLIRISDRFGVTLESILALNGLKAGAPLHVGKRLKIEGTDPAVGTRQPGRTYRVKAGDTLLNIAKKEGVPVGTLLKLNGMKLDDPLHKGRVLILEEREG